MATTPMFAPDGTLGDVPNEKIQNAIGAGFKIGRDMLAPDGTPGLVPIDKVADAAKAGFRMRGFSSMQAESPIATPGIQKPTVPMSQVYLNTGNPVQPTPSIRDMISAATRSGIQQSTPGIMASLAQKYAPNVTNKLLNMLPSDARQLVTPINQLPGQMVSTMAPIIAGGLDEPSPTIQPSARPSITNTQGVSPTSTTQALGRIMARHIPVVGRAIRTAQDVQEVMDLLGKDSPHPTATGNIAPVKTPVPETNGIKWGTGGQIPLSLRGKMIPPGPLPVYPGAPYPQNPGVFPGAPFPENPGIFPGAPYPEKPPVYPGAPLPANPGTFPGAPLPARPPQEFFQARGLATGGQPYNNPANVLGQIRVSPPTTPEGIAAQRYQAVSLEVPSQKVPLGNITPTKAATVDPYRNQILPTMTKGISGNVEAHAYDPTTSTMYTHFKSGDIYKYEGVPQQVYNQFQNANSQGSFHYNNIRGRYETTMIGKVAPTRGQR